MAIGKSYNRVGASRRNPPKRVSGVQRPPMALLAAHHFPSPRIFADQHKAPPAFIVNQNRQRNDWYYDGV
jgi:hypothetical protein